MTLFCSNCNEMLTCCDNLKLGDNAPDFEAETTQGTIKLSEYHKDSWIILFSHPADFTPVCTTELLGFAEKYEEFEKRNTKIIGLSVDSVYSHIAWIKAIEEKFGTKIPFPVIADLSRNVCDLYGMIHPNISEILPIRSVFIIDPQRIVRGMITYPSSVGRNIDEIIRILDALQTVDKEHVATPANWKPGDSVIVPPPKTMDEAQTATHHEHEECVDWFLCKRKV